MEYINLKHLAFGEVDINDEFFDSLKKDYPEFEDWYRKKREEHKDVYVQYDKNNKLQGFLYMKEEEEKVIKDVIPQIEGNCIIKIGTFKIDAHGTKMGEQFLKVVFDYAIDRNADVIYVTIYEKHSKLISLVEQYGFEKWGVKGDEKVFLKKMKSCSGDIFKDYPLVKIGSNKKYLLSIYPKYHSKMFPESILTNESRNIIKDIACTNSIQKVYVCSMRDVESLESGDIILVYRTAEIGRSAEYSAVATTVCTVIETKLQNEFSDFEEFYQYTSLYTVFDEDDLKYWYNRGGLKIIRMVYNLPLKKRIVRHDLIERVGLERELYWGFFELNDEQFEKIVELGQATEYIR